MKGMIALPRGVKGSGTTPRARKTLDEKIADIEKNIDAHKSAIAELTTQKKTLLEEKEREKTGELLKVIGESGMTADQLLELIQKNSGN